MLYKWPVSWFSGNVFKKQWYLTFVNNKHFQIAITWKSQDENSYKKIIKIKHYCRNISHIKTSTQINEYYLWISIVDWYLSLIFYKAYRSSVTVTSYNIKPVKTTKAAIFNCEMFWIAKLQLVEMISKFCLKQ